MAACKGKCKQCCEHQEIIQFLITIIIIIIIIIIVIIIIETMTFF